MLVLVLVLGTAAGCRDDDGGGNGGGGDQPRGSDAPRDASVEDFCDARRGFEYLIDHPEGGADVATNDDVEAYVTYGSKTCADIINQE